MEEELNFVKTLAESAGNLSLRYYNLSLSVEEKPNASGPVTQADRVVNEYIVRALKKRFPADAILAEESEKDAKRLDAPRVWVVDPIDGTREFIDRSGEFSTMIGLLSEGKPVLGAIFQPVRNRLFFAAKNMGAWLKEVNVTHRLSVANTVFSKLRLAVAKPWQGSRVEMIREALGIDQILPMGSAGLKLAMIASGEADLYVNPSSRLAEWDTCAAQILIEESGGSLTDLEGNSLEYNESKNVCHLKGLLASHGHCHQQLLNAIQILRARLRQTGAVSSLKKPR